MKMINDTLELFVPSNFTEIAAVEWANERNLTLWLFTSKPHYPDGIRNTPWQKIVWSYRMFIRQ